MIKEYKLQLLQESSLSWKEMNKALLNYKTQLQKEWDSGEAGIKMILEGLDPTSVYYSFEGEAQDNIWFWCEDNKTTLENLMDNQRAAIRSFMYYGEDPNNDHLKNLPEGSIYKVAGDTCVIIDGRPRYVAGDQVDAYRRTPHPKGWLEVTDRYVCWCDSKIYQILKRNNSRPNTGLNVREIITKIQTKYSIKHIKIQGNDDTPDQFIEFYGVEQELQDLSTLNTYCPQQITNWTIPVNVRKVKHTAFTDSWLVAAYHLRAERTENPKNLRAIFSSTQQELLSIGLNDLKLIIH